MCVPSGFVMCLQVDKLRKILEDHKDTQIVYFKVSSWEDFPHLPYNNLSQENRNVLESHFRKCPLYADFIRGTRSLPPEVPKVGPYG